MSNNAIHITKKYFERSNQGDLVKIKSMFDPAATYSSANTGLYHGVEDIMAMMKAFFAQFHTIMWQIDALKASNDRIIEVAFTCHATDHDGIKTVRQGTERLVVVDGLIRHIEVR